MPLALDRLPIPTLTTYSVLSTALFVSLVYHAKQVTKDPSWKNSVSLNDKNTSDILVDDEDHLIDLNSFNLPDEVDDVLLYMIQDSFSRWVSFYKSWLHSRYRICAEYLFSVFRHS